MIWHVNATRNVEHAVLYHMKTLSKSNTSLDHSASSDVNTALDGSICVVGIWKCHWAAFKMILEMRMQVCLEPERQLGNR